MRCATTRNPLARAILFAVMLAVAVTSLAAGNDCPAILPAAASAIDEPRLCRANGEDGEGIFVCRAYRDGRRVYQVLFRGGTSPVAVYEHVATNRHAGEALLQGSRRYIGKRHCNLERPLGVPTAATYRGTGVCDDEQGRPLPCSLFEHAGAREPGAMRYFVYYEPDGSGVRRIDALPAGANEYVLEAELAFQLGQALSTNACCSSRAQAYLTHATALFPDDDTYRAAVIALHGNDAKAQGLLMAAFRRMLDSAP